MGVVDAKERVVPSFAEWNSRGPPACKLDDAESQRRQSTDVTLIKISQFAPANLYKYCIFCMHLKIKWRRNEVEEKLESRKK
jgi:type VI protein secretion system component Hcp